MSTTDTATTTTTPDKGGDQQQQQPASLTQADVDRIVQERVQRERAKYADYDELKAKVAGAKSAEDRIADLEAKLAESAKRDAHRQMIDTVVREHKLTNPDDIALVGAAVDEDSAKRLAKRLAEDNRRGNYVPGEGKSTNPPGADPVREFARGLFQNSKE